MAARGAYAAAGFGVTILAAALAPTLTVELIVLVVASFAGTSFLATGNSTLQLTSDASHRGRVMALWSVTFLGSTPIGGPIVGAVAEYIEPRFGLALGGLPAWRPPRSAPPRCGAYRPARASPRVLPTPRRSPCQRAFGSPRPSRTGCPSCELPRPPVPE